MALLSQNTIFNTNSNTEFIMHADINKMLNQEAKLLNRKDGQNMSAYYPYKSGVACEIGDLTSSQVLEYHNALKNSRMRDDGWIKSREPGKKLESAYQKVILLPLVLPSSSFRFWSVFTMAKSTMNLKTEIDLKFYQILKANQGEYIEW
jgi:hypothetical protein